MDINLLYVAVNGDSCPDVPFFMHNICQPEKQGHFGRNKPNLEQQFDWFWFWGEFLSSHHTTCFFLFTDFGYDNQVDGFPVNYSFNSFLNHPAILGMICNFSLSLYFSLILTILHIYICTVYDICIYIYMQLPYELLLQSHDIFFNKAFFHGDPFEPAAHLQDIILHA